MVVQITVATIHEFLFLRHSNPCHSPPSPTALNYSYTYSLFLFISLWNDLNNNQITFLFIKVK